MTDEHPATELATVLAHLQGLLLSRTAATAAVSHLARAAAGLIDSAAGAGVSLLDETENRITTAATDPVVAAADTTQYDLDEGPCLTAWATGTTQRLENTATDTHWPAFSAALAPLGVVSMLSTPLMHAGHTLGVLKVYATTADAFTRRDEAILTELATVAATLLSTGQHPETAPQLSTTVHDTLADRQIIATATGILMERHHLPHPEAHRLLLESARAQPTPLPQYARHLLEHPTHQDPEP